jgi:CheY-like chemotaxis protein
VSRRLVGTSVFMVDDDADGLSLLEFVFEQEGATVRKAGSAREALEILSSWTPDVMLLDIALPEMNGYELLKAIRRAPTMRNVPAVAVTAHAYERDKLRAIEAGFSVHVSKPFDSEALVYLIANLKPNLRTSEDPRTLRALQAVLAAQGVHEALGFLNRRAPHRFTGIYRFDGDTLRNLDLFDRLDRKAAIGLEDPMRETYGSIVRASREPFVVSDAPRDARLVEHPARGSVQSYCGVLLRHLDGTPFGSLCHFDVVPLEVARGVLDLLLHAAPLISAVVVDRET